MSIFISLDATVWWRPNLRPIYNIRARLPNTSMVIYESTNHKLYRQKHSYSTGTCETPLLARIWAYLFCSTRNIGSDMVKSAMKEFTTDEVKWWGNWQVKPLQPRWSLMRAELELVLGDAVR